MDDIHESEQPPVYHERDSLDGLWAECPPRLFVLVQEYEEEGGGIVRDVVAYGIAMPDGSAATVSAKGRSAGRRLSPESASRRLCSELRWLASAT